MFQALAWPSEASAHFILPEFPVWGSGPVILLMMTWGLSTTIPQNHQIHVLNRTPASLGQHLSPKQYGEEKRVGQVEAF